MLVFWFPLKVIVVFLAGSPSTTRTLLAVLNLLVAESMSMTRELVTRLVV